MVKLGENTRKYIGINKTQKQINKKIKLIIKKNKREREKQSENKRSNTSDQNLDCEWRRFEDWQ